MTRNKGKLGLAPIPIVRVGEVAALGRAVVRIRVFVP
jgi:hypothetical protein